MSTNNFDPLVSLFPNAWENLPTDVHASGFIAEIKAGKHQRQVEIIRERFKRALARGIEYEKAKKTVEKEKKKLPAAAFAGVLPMRDKSVQPTLTGLLQADLDLLGDRFDRVRDTLKTDPHVFALFTSPTGEGLKAIYRVPICKNEVEYKLAFAAVESRVNELTGEMIDSLPDFTRLCFTSYDPDAFHNPNAIELSVDLAQAVSVSAVTTPSKPRVSTVTNGESRRSIAEKILGRVDWQSDTLGFCECPGISSHTSGDAAKDCRVTIDGAPNVYCLHKSCAAIVTSTNRELQSQIGKAEFQPTRTTPTRNGTIREIISEADTVSDDLPEIIDAFDALPADWKEPAEVVRGLLHQGSKMVLGGGSKSFKTWGLTDLAISVAQGSQWWGFDTVRGKVLYLNFEIQPYFFHQRINKIAQSKSSARQKGQLSVWNLRGKSCDFSTLLPKISERVKGNGYSLIVVDPIYKGMAGRDENKASDIANLLNEIERLAVETGAAVVFGAHFSKGNQAGKESIDRISGSGVFARDPDSILVMTNHQEPGAFTIEATLRNFAPIEAFCVRWQHPLFHRDATLDPDKLKQAGGRKREHTADNVLELLGDKELTATEWQKLADTEQGVGRRTFYDLKKSLVQSGRVHQSPITNKWQRNIK